jgi:23S rRNA pseudouridine2605 synthase
MRIARALSVVGWCSRREAERLIAEGRVAVNGQVARTPATLVNLAADHLSVDGRNLSDPVETRYIALHKPRGVVSTARDPHAERTVVELVPSSCRLYPVGRLDKDSEGLILLTNDGEFANRVAHPRFETEKEYLALVRERPNTAALERLRKGVALDGRPTAPARVGVLEGTTEGCWLRLVLHEGRNREVRRMLETVGHPVLRLIRTRVGPVYLGTLRPGEYRDLRAEEVTELARFVVAIDGPSAAGKTTVGQRVAECLDAAFLDSGVLYRALTLAALERGIAPSDAQRLAALAADLDVRVRLPSVVDGRITDVLIGDRDVTRQLRSEAVEAHVSQVASHAAVRDALIPAQRRAADAPRAVVVGRDIGTVIFPDANVKIYLEASPRERARRRRAQFEADGSLDETEQAIALRDEQDRNRATAPLVRAPDAIVVETDGLPVEDIVQRICRIAGKRGVVHG